MTRTLRLASRLAFSGLLLLPAASQAQSAGSIVGFGGLTMNQNTFTSPDFGGNVAFELTPGVELIGEAGRVANVVPTNADTIFSAVNSGIRASAFYADGGVRFVLSPHSRVSPYAEATAGMSRLDVTSTRLGPLAGGLTSAAIAFLDRTAPVAGAGGGLLVSAGPVVLDVGYRYKQFFASEPLETVLGLGQGLRSHQARFGIGVRF